MPLACIQRQRDGNVDIGGREVKENEAPWIAWPLPFDGDGRQKCRLIHLCQHFFYFYFIYFYLRPGGLFKLLINFKWGLDYPSCHCAIANFGRFVIKNTYHSPFYPCQDIIWENLANIYVYSGL